MMKKAQAGAAVKTKAKLLPKAGKQTPADFDPESYDKKYPRTPGGGANYPEPNGKRGVGPSKKPKMKMGGSMKKAEDGTKFGMASVNAGYDNNSDATAADRIVLAKKNAGKAKLGAMMKNGGAMKKAMMGTGMHKMPDGSMMENSMMKKGGSLKKKMQYGGKAASMTPPAMMKKGGMMKKCKYGCK